MISHDLKTIFIHIPKCAGTSVESAFGHHDGLVGRGLQDHRTIRQIERPLFTRNVFLSRENFTEFACRTRTALVWHARATRLLKPAANVKNRYSVTNKQYEDYTKLALVRNPWSRAFSWYKNVMRDKLHQSNLKISGDMSFDEFVRLYNGKGILRPQTYWLKNSSGHLPFDYIGKMESLDEDFAIMCELLGLERLSLPHKIRGDTTSYKDAFNHETMCAVANVCAEEIDLFKYRFGDP